MSYSYPGGAQRPPQRGVYPPTFTSAPQPHAPGAGQTGHQAAGAGGVTRSGGPALAQYPRTVHQETDVVVFPYGPGSQQQVGVASIVEESPNPGSAYFIWLCTPPAQGQRAQSDPRMAPAFATIQMMQVKVWIRDIVKIRHFIPDYQAMSQLIIISSSKALPPLYFQPNALDRVMDVFSEYLILTPSQDGKDCYDCQDIVQYRIAAENKARAQVGEDFAARAAQAQPSSARSMMSGMLTGFARVTSLARDAVLDPGSMVQPASNWLYPSLGGGDADTPSLPSYPPPAHDMVAPLHAAQSVTPPPRSPSGSTHSLQEDDFELVGDEEDVGARAERERLLKEAREKVVVEPRQAPLSVDEWISLFDEYGCLSQRKWDAVRLRMFRGGFDPAIRPEAWKYLLGYYPLGSNIEERGEIDKEKKAQYYMYKRQWSTVTPEQEENWSELKQRKHNIDKDVVRTDRNWAYYKEHSSPNLRILNDVLLTYTFYNYDLGYVQGMNDLVSILLIVMDSNEVETFWCFKGLMDRIGDNFEKHQTGMHRQLGQISLILKYIDYEFWLYLKKHNSSELFFCFRWLLILFKREFPLLDVLRIWESIWCDFFCTYHHLFITVAMVLRYRDRIMNEEMEFDDILKFVNDLSMQMNAAEILSDAEYWFHVYCHVCNADVRKTVEEFKPEKLGLT